METNVTNETEQKQLPDWVVKLIEEAYVRGVVDGREKEEDRAALDEIETQLQDIFQEREWQAYWQQLPRREYRIQRDDAMPYAAARALVIGHRHEAVARVAGEKVTAWAQRHIYDMIRLLPAGMAKAEAA